MQDRNYITEGEVVDTHGGDYTWRDVWWQMDGDRKVFFQQCYGAKPSAPEQIENPE